MCHWSLSAQSFHDCLPLRTSALTHNISLTFSLEFTLLCLLCHLQSYTDCKYLKWESAYLIGIYRPFLSLSLRWANLLLLSCIGSLFTLLGLGLGTSLNNEEFELLFLSLSLPSSNENALVSFGGHVDDSISIHWRNWYLLTLPCLISGLKLSICFESSFTHWFWGARFVIGQLSYSFSSQVLGQKWFGSQ